jgi:rubrerythrin
MTKKNLETLEAALKFEEDERNFFLAASQKTKEMFGKSTFLSLADAEPDHTERIKSIYKSLIKTGEWPDIPSPFCPGCSVEKLFEEAMSGIAQNVEPTTGELEALKLGIQFEGKGVKLYTEMSNEASHPLEKKFYTQLADEERGHILILKDAEAYYADPVHWFSSKERSHWDGQ